MALHVANLFMGWLESGLLDNSPVTVNTDLWKRFLDDVSVLWTGTSNELQVFATYMNTVTPHH